MSDLTLRAKGLRFSYDARPEVLRGVDIEVPRGRLICLLGPNGCGKTTLLRSLLGLLHPQKGAVLLQERPLNRFTPRERALRLAYVPQQPDVAFGLPARDVVLTGRLPHVGLLGLAGERDRSIAEEAMRATDTLAFADRPLDALSGGEAQRVMVARALAQEPAAILLDEPTSHLDLRGAVHIYRLLAELAHDRHVAALTVSHDINLAARFADELVLMAEGRVVAHGAPADLLDAALLSRVFGVPVETIPTPDGLPVVRATVAPTRL